MGIPKKILVVDDDPVIQKMASQTLRKAGYDVKVAIDGVQALVALKDEKPDLMVLDIMMPEMNGYSVCHTLSVDPDLKDLPILILTSRGVEETVHMGVFMDIEYMHKSCTAEEFLATVNKRISSCA